MEHDPWVMFKREPIDREPERFLTFFLVLVRLTEHEKNVLFMYYILKLILNTDNDAKKICI